jgi:colicin import membrane protein
LREWRHLQRQQVKVMRYPLPDALHEIIQQTGRTVWETAQRMANEALDSARVAFEAEKSDLTRLSVEQSEAFDSVSTALEQVQAENDRFRAELESTRKITAETVERLQGELAQVRAKAEASEQMHSERTSGAEAERDLSRREAIEAREAAAALRGQIEAMTAQNAALLAMLSTTTAKTKKA